MQQAWSLPADDFGQKLSPRSYFFCVWINLLGFGACSSIKQLRLSLFAWLACCVIEYEGAIIESDWLKKAREKPQILFLFPLEKKLSSTL